MKASADKKINDTYVENVEWKKLVECSLNIAHMLIILRKKIDCNIAIYKLNVYKIYIK